MAYQIVAVNDASPGACVDVGLTWNGSDTLTSTEAISGTSLTLSSTITGGANTDIALNTNTFTVDAGTGALACSGTFAAGGVVTLTGATTCSSTLTVDGASTLTGNVAAAGTLTVTGESTFNNHVNLGAGDDLKLSSTSEILVNTDKFTVDGSNGNTLVAGTFEATGASTLTGAVGCAASITLGANADLIGSSTSDITIDTNKFTVAGATGNVGVGGTLTTTGVTTHNEAVGFGAEIEAAANGAYAIPVDTMVTTVETNAVADLDASLADGQDGQIKIVILGTDGGSDVVITPANFGNGATLTLDTVKDYAVFAFDGTNWWAVSHSGTIA